LVVLLKEQPAPTNKSPNTETVPKRKLFFFIEKTKNEYIFILSINYSFYNVKPTLQFGE